jgi:hypothetical protein
MSKIESPDASTSCASTATTSVLVWRIIRLVASPVTMPGELSGHDCLGEGVLLRRGGRVAVLGDKMYPNEKPWTRVMREAHAAARRRQFKTVEPSPSSRRERASDEQGKGTGARRWSVAGRPLSMNSPPELTVAAPRLAASALEELNRLGFDVALDKASRAHFRS